MKKTAIAAFLCASPAFAGGYSEHEAIVAFSQAPCSEFISAVEGKALAASFLLDDAEQTMKLIAQNGMMWGVLLGYDAHAGGFHTENSTTLERLKAACSVTPEKSARDILDSL
jgi:hypothetical protein